MISFPNILLYKCFGYHTTLTDYYANSDVSNYCLLEKLVFKYL